MPGFGVLTNSQAGFSRIMAEGLDRMLKRLGRQSRVMYDGLDMLYRPGVRLGGAYSTLRNLVKQVHFYSRLAQFDAIIIVSTIPDAFGKSFRVERIRRWLPGMPIVLYDVLYLPSSGYEWNRWLREGRPDHGNPEIRSGGQYGLNRYDWYLCASATAYAPIPRDEQPLSVIGLDLDDGTLFPDQGNQFVALIDFEVPVYMKERSLQIIALDQTNTPYIVLNGRYSIPEIRSIYRRCSIYFLATPESFGLPICELQACGSYVFTPHSHWARAHWHKADPHVFGAGELSPNFVVYGDTVESLIGHIERVKRSYNSAQIVDTLNQYHPHFSRGDLSALEDFLARLDDGRIHSRLHATHIPFIEVDS